MLAASFVAVDIVFNVEERLFETAADCEHVAQGGSRLDRVSEGT